MNVAIEKIVTENFHRLYYHSGHTWNEGHTRWMGIPCFQNPLDMWILQEIIFETRPSVIIETGTFYGGSTLFLSHMMDIMDIKRGIIISMDTEDKCAAKHYRIKKFTGKSVDEDVIRVVKETVWEDDKVMVILDSDHSTENVLAEMKLYSPLITPGCYMVVCDSNLGGNPIENLSVPGPGPMKAIEMFMKENDEFEIDVTKEKFYFTFCPNGWLRRK